LTRSRGFFASKRLFRLWRRKKMRERERLTGLEYGEELRTGSAGVPLALAPTLYHRVVKNREGLKKVSIQIGLSKPVAMRMSYMLRKHGLPSRDRLIALSLGYPERTYRHIAAAFGVSDEVVRDCDLRIDRIRKAEPLSSEYWEDILETDLTQDEIYARAAVVRRRNELAQSGLLAGPWRGTPGREALGGDLSDCWGGCGSREEVGSS
jgi:hypothetical protein